MTELQHKKGILTGFEQIIGGHDIPLTYQDSYGKTLWKYYVTFDNGDNGEALSRTANPIWKIGKTYRYVLETIPKNRPVDKDEDTHFRNIRKLTPLKSKK